jgi:serine/threonine protein kinase
MSEKYKIIRKLDTGGMAEVYVGLQESTQGIEKLVAIKRVLPNLTQDHKFVQMFLDEARLSMYLSHSNIVQVFDLGRTDEAYFIVMEFIDGTSLKSIFDFAKTSARTLPVEQVLYLAMMVCEGLSYAHEFHEPVQNKPLNIVHRDVSPHNVLVSRWGEVKLVDFGLAKAASHAIRTDTGVVKGKFNYLSPEAAMGQVVDHRADIFSVGIVIWELLAGRRLFYGLNNFQTLELVKNAQVPPLSGFHPQVTPELDALIQGALSRDREHRYQSAQDLAEALAYYLFEHRLKVTAFDLRRLVKETLDGRSEKAESSLIHSLLNEEMLKFQSIRGSEILQETLSENLLDPRVWG